MKNKLLVCLLAFTMILSLSACGDKQPAVSLAGGSSSSAAESSSEPSGSISEPASGSEERTDDSIDVLTVGTNMEFATPSRDDYNTGIITRGLVSLTLATKDEEGNYLPSLATDWTTEDAMKWSFNMRDDLTWHDGVPVTAEDVAFTIEYQKEKSAMASYTLGNVESINVIDDYSFDINLKTPNSRVLEMFFTVMPKHVFENVDDYEAYTGDDALLGNGPYEVTKFDVDAKVVEFTARDDFYMGTPKVKKIVYKTYGTPDTLYMALQNGEVDMIYDYAKGVDTSIIDTFMNDENISTKIVNNTGLPAGVYINTTAAPFDRIEVRQAIQSAIDYDQMAALFGSELATAPAAGVLPEGSYGYVDKGNLSRDLDKAKRILEDIGCTDSDGDGIYELGGKALDFEVTINSSKELMGRIGEILKNNLSEAGINVVINTVDSATFSQIADIDHSHVALLTGATPAGMNTNAGCGTAYYDARYYGWSMVKDETFQTIVDHMLSATTMEEYEKLAGDVQQWYVDNIPIIPLYNDVYVLAYSVKLDNLFYDGNYGLNNVYTMYNVTKAE